MNPSKSKSPINPKKLLLLCALSVSALNAFAQVSGTYISTNNWNWGTAGNWSPATVPDAAGATASFNAVTNTALANKTIVLGGTRTIGTLNVTGGNGVNASGTLAIGNAGQLLTFNNGAGDAVINLGGGITLRVLANVSAGGNLQVNNDSGVIGSVVLGGTTTITGTAKFNNADPYAGITVSGRLIAGGLSKDGSGSLILSGSGNTVAGNVAFNNGTIVIGNNNVLGSGTINLLGTGARRLNLLDATDRALSNAINLATVNLMVGREDGSTTATALRTLTINPNAASVSALGSGTRTLTVDSLTGLTFGNNQSFSGGTLLKDGGGVLTLGGAASTFSKLQVEMGTVKGFLNGNTTLGGGPSVFGAGNISVSGGDTVLEITGTNNADTLTIGNNANINLSGYATFRLSGGGLALVGGTINLNGNGILDYGAGTVTLGNTAILGASAEGFNFGSNLIFTNNTGITNTGSFRYNLTNSGTQILSRDTTGAVTVSGTMIKTGAGNTVIDPSITSLTLTRGLQLDAGTLTFTAANQYPSALAFTGTAATVSLGGFNQSVGAVSVSGGAQGVFALGGDLATSTQLALGAVTLGNPASRLKIRDYTDGTLLVGTPDKVTISGGIALDQVWFHGYNKGATLTSGELKPANGLLNSRFIGGSNIEWHNPVNWLNTYSADADAYNIPNSPGAIAYISQDGGSLYNKTITTGTGITLGELRIASASNTYINGTITFDSGKPGVAAIFNGGGMQFYLSSATVRLKSDLTISNMQVWSSIGNIHDDYETSGIGRKVIFASGLVTELYGPASSFRGGLEMNNGVQIGLMNNNSTVTYSNGTWLGLGPVTINGSVVLYGRHLDARQYNALFRLTNQFILNGNLTTGGVYYDYAGDVNLTATRTINSAIATQVTNYAKTDSTIFGKDWNFTGVGGLTFSGAQFKRLLGANHTFTGGLSNINGTLWGDATYADGHEVVLGSLAAGKNPLGPGTVSVNPTSTTVANILVVNAVKTTLASGTINLGTTTYGTFGVLDGDTYLTGGAVIGSGWFRTDGDLYFGSSATVANANFSFMGDSLTKKIRAVAPGAVTIRNVLKDGAGTATIDASITKLTAGTVTVSGGMLALGANNQLDATTLALNGGMFSADGFRNSGIVTLNLLADSALQLGTGGGLQFSTVGTGANWLSSALLTIQNNGGAWAAGDTGSYVRFSSDITSLLTAPLLGNIGFTGYESGAKIQQAGGYYYLLPDAVATNEWSGDAADHVKWGVAGNWLNNSVPAGSGVSVSFRDLDASLGGKTVDVDGAYTLGRLSLQATPGFTLGGSGTLIFNNGADRAAVNSSGGGQTVTAAWRLDSDLDLNLAISRAGGQLALANTISGAGDMYLNGGNTALNLGGNNAAWSGNLYWNDSTQRLRVTTTGTAPLTGSGTFFIGGTGAVTNDYYYIEPYGAARTVRLAGGAVLNANLALAQNSDGVTDNGNFYNLTLTGGTLELSGTGQRIITVASLGEQVRPVLSIYNVISGSAGLTKAGGGSLVLYGNNTFTGDFNWTDGMVYAYADNALGLGTVRFNLSSDSKYMYALSDGARFSNQIVSAGNRTVGAGGLFYWNANSSVVGSSTINGFLSITGGTHIFGKEHVITGNGYMTRAALWMLGGDNTFTGNNSFTYGSYYVIGASSTKDENGVVTKGPLGVGTLTTGGNIGSAGLYVYSDTETEQRLGNTIVFGGDVLVGISFRGAAGALPAIVNGTATPNKATTLVLDANTLTLRPNHASVIRPDGATLRIESQIKDAVGGTLNSVAKEGAGVLVLTNAANEISGGIDARLGTVRLVATGNSNVQIGGGGASPLGTGQLRTQTATGAGNAGAFEIVAADSGTVTLLGTDRIVLNNNGQFRVTGSNVTTVLANNGALISTGAVGQEGSLVADLVKTTNYTLTAKIAARNWQLDAGTVNLARANLTNSAGTITFTAGSVLNVNHHVQTLPNIVVDGNATINVSGGVPSNPVTLTVGSVTVNSGTLMFSGWAGDIPTGKGSTIVQSTLNVGTVVHDVSLASGVGQAIVRRNIDGVSVLMPYDLIFTWDGAANNNLWTENDWIKNGQHTASEQPDGITATAIFDTDTASLANQTISLNGERKVGTLQFTGATKTGYTISGAGNAILLDSGVSGADTFIKNDGASDVTLNTDLRLVYYAPDGENLNIEQNGAGHLFFNGQISGPDSVVSVEGAGAGAVIFSGNNTFSRGFILNSGNVWLGADSVAGNGPLGGGLVTLRGGTLRGVTSGGTTGANRTLTNDYNLDGGFVLAGANTLTLAGDGAISQNSTVNTGNGSVILGATGKTLTVSGSKQLTTVGAVTVNGGVALGGALETNISDTTTMNATVSGAGQLTKTGAGTLLLTGSNTSTGGFALAAGVTGVNNSAALGTGTATLGGGTLRLNANNLNLANNVSAGGGVIDTQANTGTLSGKIAGSGGFTKTGSGALTVTQSNSYTGTTNISAGAVISSQADALGASAVVVSSSLTLAFNNATYDNATSGAGNITVSGTGVRVDSVANTTTGTWNIAGSALINDANNLGPNGKVNLSGTLTTDGNNNLTFTNTLTGAGVINFTGSGTHGLAGTGTNFTGTARANGGVFDWSATTSAALTKATLETVSGKLSVGSGTQSAAKLIMNGGTTQFTGTARVTNYTISATSSVLFDLADLSSRSLLQQDEPVNNTLIISTNNWTGSLNDLRLVTAGGTVLGVTSTLPVGTGTEALGVYSNTLGKTGNNLTLAYALQELKLQPNKTLTLTGDTTATGGAELHALISGAGNLTIAANNAITLNTKETFTGTLTVTTGTLVAGVADVVASSTRLIVNSALALNNYNQTVNNLSGATAGRVLLGSNTLTVNTTLSSTYAGVITGAGALVKTGADTLTLSGSSTYSGPTNLTSGTLRATNASALGSGTAAVAATLVTEFTGTLSNNLTGSGTVRAVSGANVTLAGNNASLTGLLDILAGGKVTARAATNIGTARLTVGGTFIADNNAAWTLTNTLSGAGVLLKQNTANLIITQANTAFTGTASIVGGTLTLGHLQGIGSAAITDNAVLQLSNLSGTLTNKISGAGNVDVNASAVTLSGSNTLSGTFQVAAGSNLKAVNQYSLGSGKVSNSGTLTLGGINNYQLSIENLINGTGQLVKEDANTVTVSHSNSYTGGSVIRGGELNLANLNGLGSGNVANSAALRLSANNGSFANNVSGSGTVHVSGSGINLTGTNTVAAWRVTGSGTVSGTANLGLGALFLDGGALNFTPANNASVTLANALTGNGSLIVTLGGNTSQWNFASTTGATFTGTLNLRQGEYKFSTADQTGAGALKQATLTLSQVDTNNVGSANVDQNYTIGSLNMNGGVLKTTLSGSNTASGTLTVTKLLSAAGGGKLQANGLDVTGITGTVAAGQDFFADSGNANRYQIEVVRATGTALGAQLTLVDQHGAVIGAGQDLTRAVADGSGTAHYNYAATLGTRADGAQGLFIGYGLTELQANSGTQVLLSNGATAAVLDAKLTGAGGFRIAGGAAVASLGNAASNYTGTTSVTSGTVRLTADNGFGWSSLLELAAATQVDLNNVTQNVGGLDVAANASLRLGADGSLAVNNMLGSGDAVNAGLLDADGGRLGVSGNLVNSGTVLGGAANPAAVTVGGTLTNSGQMNLVNRSLTAGAYSGSANSALSVGGTLAVNGLLANSGTLTVGKLAAATQVVNQGLLTGAGAGEDSIGGNLVNSGTVDLAARALAVGGAYTGSAGSALSVGSGSIGGAASVAANATVSAGTLAVDGAIVNSGSIRTNQLTAQAAYSGSAGSVLNLNGGAAAIAGPLSVADGGQILLGSNGSLTASGGGHLAGDGALSGSGTLRVSGNNNLLTVSGSNAVALVVTIDTTDTLELQHLAALGNSGTVNTAGTLRLSGVNGAFALDLAGGGNVSATDAANVSLTGSNSFSGTWQIAADSGLKAVSANSLGSGRVTVSGTLTLGAPSSSTADWALNSNNTISGNGKLVKEDNNTVTVSHSNSYSGGSVINSGELNLANLNGLGSGNVVNSAALRLSANNGSFNNNLSGTGVTIISGSGVTVSGTNGTFTGTWDVTGSGTMTAQQNLGAVGVTAVNLSGDLALILGAIDYDFNQPLSGSGTLTVNNSGTLNFTGNTGSSFTGNVMLQHNQFALDGDNTAALAHATLTVGAGNHTVVGSGTQHIGNLTLNSGTLGFTLAASGTAAEGLVNTGTLTVGAAAVVVINTGSFNNGALPLLQQDERRDIQLVAATALGAGSVTQITGTHLLDQDGNQLTDATHQDIVQGGAVTAGGTYDFAAMVSGSGLYLGYELTALELLAGQTTVLDHDLANAVLAGADELHARVSGSGNLQISASNSITINNGGNNYTGATLVTGGTLIVGNSGALGDTALLDLAADTTVDLNGQSQTVGAFNGSAGSTLNLNGGELTVSGGNGDSVSLGRLTGSGTLSVEDASFSVSGSNRLGGLVDIAAAAVVVLDDAGGLGASEIALGGSLVLSATVSGELVNSLSGSGALVQQGSETVTIAQANDGFGGTVRVQSGALALEHVAGVGTAGVTIEQGGVLAYRNASGTLQNNLGGEGELVLLSSSLTVTDERAVDVALVSLAAGSVTLDSANSFGRQITVDADSQILLARDGAQLGHVTNHGLLEFGDGSGGFKTARVGDLSGGGVIVLNVNIAAQQGDRLQTGAVSGTHGIVFNRLDGPGGVTGKEKILLIETAGGGAFVSGTLQDGMFKYTVLDGAGNPNLDGNADNWWLMGNGLSTDGRVILSVAGAASLGWFAQQDSLLQRLGGLRLDYEQLDGRGNLAKHGAGDVWARGYGQQVNAGGGASGAAFQDTLWGTDLGADKLWQLNSGNVLYTGVFGGYGQSSLEFRQVTASAESNNYQGGVYATWLHDTGWYADWVAKAAYLDSSFETFDLSGKNRGEYNNWAAGTSVEVGRKIQLPGRWFIEPQAQLSYVHIFGADYSTRGVSDLAVSQADADILQGRLGALFGKTIVLNNRGILQPYAKAMAVGQTSSGGTVTASSGGAIQGADGRWRPNYDGLRAQFGAGLIWQLDEQNQLHLDYQAEFGDKFDQPWGVTAGYRYQF